MSDHETVVGTPVNSDLVCSSQKEQIAKMRAALIGFGSNANTTRAAIQSITAMRVYHQITRIIKYTEIMDKLEDKMYESIECSLATMNSASPTTWLQLVQLQEKLMKNMEISNKLIQPYLGADWETIVPTSQSQDATEYAVLDSSSRQTIRDAAKQVLSLIESGDLDG